MFSDFADRAKSLSRANAGTLVWAGNGMGKIECLDLRMNKMQGSLKGPAGAVKSLALHPDLPIIASVGLDRFFRVHNIESKALLCKLYLKQQLTAVAWSPEVAQIAVAAEATAAAQVARREQSDAVPDADASLEEVSNVDPSALKHKSKRSSPHKKSKSHRKKQKLGSRNPCVT